jgi:GntR family transcriptional regulator, transcriptional repressor for pyruvate dehydrogenase complex
VEKADREDAVNLAAVRAAARRRKATSSRRVRIPKASELVADAIRAQIASGEVVGGSALPNETELMGEYAVSRQTVREALRVLETEGLIEVQRGAGGGARVRSPDIDAASRHCALLLQLRGATIADVYEVRLMLEPTAARLAAERAPKRAARALEEVIAEEEQMIGGSTSLLHHAVRFQQKLVELSGNPALELLVRLLHDLVARQGVAPAPRVEDEGRRIGLRRRLIRAQHEVAEAIGEGRGEDAERLWRRYLSGLAASLLGDVESAVPVKRHGERD